MLKMMYRMFRKTVYTRVARELSLGTRYFDRVWYWASGDDDVLADWIDASELRRIEEVAEFEGHVGVPEGREAIVLNGVLNSSLDVQAIFSELSLRMERGDRVSVVMYNPYFKWAYGVADRLRLRSAPAAQTFVTRVDLLNLARISGMQVVRIRYVSPFPYKVFGIGSLIDAVVRATPLLRQFAPVQVAVLRSTSFERTRPSFSVVIPARNEQGNIRDALRRFPVIDGADTEVVFVEGNSTDDTWGEIERAVADYDGHLRLQAHRQPGKGKADAVRLGFAEATGDLLTILDADLTVPPEMIPRFYEAYCAGHGDFCNGSRLVYPMEAEAMRFLNRLGNIFFAKALSSVLEARLGDTLCGTKLLHRRDYDRVTAWREDFGDFDPFGDFELLFPAAILGLGIVDVPIRYRERTYGETNISRFRHGLLLVKMTLVGLFRIRMGLHPTRAKGPAA